MLTKKDYEELYKKRLNGHCSNEELELLDRYEQDFQMIDLNWDVEKWGDKQAIHNHIQYRLDQHINQPERRKRTLKIFYISSSVAAAILLLFGIFWNTPKETRTLHLSVQTKNDRILPGCNKATLSLEDGTMVDLNAAEIGNIVTAGNILAKKQKDGELEYARSITSASKKISYHTIRTPRGGQYQINLSDGTQVWLNAASSIKFPVSFTGNERVVEITGEVYFDVQKQPDKPFIVKTPSNQTIKVLGTKFNVTAYPEEASIHTSLIEGKVLLEAQKQTYIMLPGQQIVYNSKDNTINKTSFDEEEVLAWQQGYFKFNSERIESIMQKISRWYDVDVIYQGNMEGQAFSGKISRYENVEDLLKKLTLTGTIKFKIEGRRIYVMT